MWKQQKLIEKAVDNKTYADLWLFVALHFICALRVSDMIRIPAPAIPYDGETLLKAVSDGIFPGKEASMLCDELTLRLKFKPLKPSKTAAHEKVPELKLFVPESLRIPLGKIIAIVLAHHPEIRAGDGFVQPNTNLHNIRSFFGERFVKALGSRRFSSRRGNKSYLQGIDTTVANMPGKPKGYMLAALARSHKNGIGNLSRTTDVYLKDASFSGYSPEFIIQQMFERGIFSFIPAVLLEIHTGNSYIRLPVITQTKLIGELGLTAVQIENISEAVERAMTKSRISVQEILEKSGEIKPRVFGLLQRIASGSAPGKQDGYLCLMMAAGSSCPFADRDACIGCDYEILTKSAMHTLMQEYSRLVNLEQSATQSDIWRYGKILEQAILPAVTEMLTATKLFYPKADVSELLDILEEAVNCADSDAGTNKRGLQSINDGQRDRR